MGKLQKVLFLMCALAISAGELLYADYGSCDPCCCPSCEIYLDIDALYWKTMHCPIFVARRSIGNQASLGSPRPRDDLYHMGEFDGGVRARLGYQQCNTFTDLSYLYFYSKDDESEDMDDFNRMRMAFLPGVNNQSRVLNVASKAEFRYQNVDGRFGRFFCFSDCFNAFFYGNARWVKIDFKQSLEGTSEDIPSSPNSAKQDSHFNGAGLGLGTGARYRICGNFGLTATTGVMAIIGESNLKNFASTWDENSGLHDSFLDNQETWCHILPAFDFRVGLEYACCWHCFDMRVEVGYELNYYNNILRYASENSFPSPGSAEIPVFSCQDIGFGGPYLNIQFTF